MQLPYGVLCFALITAILPRMSRAAAEGRIPAIKQDFSPASRICSTAMLPMSALMTVLGPSLGIALFSIGKSRGDAGTLGIALAWLRSPEQHAIARRVGRILLRLQRRQRS